jgi:hypothetical protein
MLLIHTRIATSESILGCHLTPKSNSPNEDCTYERWYGYYPRAVDNTLCHQLKVPFLNIIVLEVIDRPWYKTALPGGF